MNEYGSPQRITIIGGGFTGASLAVQLVRASREPLDITIVEPRDSLGAGLAHSADDPDHRLNGPTFVHYLDPMDPLAFDRWVDERGLIRDDPGARVPGGQLFVRRRAFGEFVADVVRVHAKWPTGSTIRHVRDLAVGLTERGGTYIVRTESGQHRSSDMVLVATGNALPRLPAEFRQLAESNPRVIAVPTDLQRVRGIPKTARVLLLGSGLTAMDILSTLVRSGHEGPITSISRKGLRPASQRPPPPGATVATKFNLAERIDAPVAPFLRKAGDPPTVRKLMRALRDRIREVEAGGDVWYTPYDDVRETFWRVWSTLPLEEKRRYLKRLRPIFDAYRFRTPPQNEALVRAAENAGAITFLTTRVHQAQSTKHGVIRVSMRDKNELTDRLREFDAVINCTGLDAAAGAKDNPFLKSLVQEGVLCIDPTGVGFSADDHCRAIRSDGQAQERLRVVGPPTLGKFADLVGAPFIANHIRRVLPDILATLAPTPFKSQSSATAGASPTKELSA